jgi:hypothetical protein
MTLAGILARVEATEIINWPSSVLEHAFTPPVYSVKIAQGDNGLRATDPLPPTHAGDLFPKLGVKSWQETGRLRIIRAGQPLVESVAGLLATPTRQHLCLMAAWQKAQLHLHLFAWHDFTQISEARYLVSGGTCARTSLCLRGAATEAVVAQTAAYARNLAKGTADRIDAGSVIVQVAIEASGRVTVLDVNPGLTPAETSMLLQEA